MEKRFGIAVIILVVLCDASEATEKATYIIHTKESNLGNSQYYELSLRSVSETAEVLYEYTNALNGYSVILTIEEAEALKALPEVISVTPEQRYSLHTTRSPEFLGLFQHEEILPSPQRLSDIIVGFLDTGIWPESQSFHDTGLGPIRNNWRGACEAGRGFTKSMCNRKLVGARFFSRGYEADMANESSKIDWSVEYKSPRDSDGHGTHTSSTAVGSPVPGANLYGYANGTARGMAPQARFAMYKCCWGDGPYCLSSDILAAMDKAIEDNVDVMSLSIGGGVVPYDIDPIAIGAFSAMVKGIFVACSAGNDGPNVSSVENVSPWITTVGAGTLDRDFPVQVKLGNGEILYGTSINDGHYSLGDDTLYPLIFADNATSNSTHGHLCLPSTLFPDKVRNKIVLCDRGENDRVEKGYVVKAAGGAGMVMANTIAQGEELVADAHLLPAAAVGQKDGAKIKKYLFSNHNPTATLIFQGTKLGVQPAPVVAAFSSRGPSPIVPEILKPDLIAPGVNILAAYTDLNGPSYLPVDKRRVSFNIDSGTSMSCPHVSGLAALLKATHPDWSPAAIRSALMTTAYSTYNNRRPMLDVSTSGPSTPFAHGSGYVNPMAALNPGLVYDLNKTDYLRFLCALGYKPNQIKKLTRETTFTCNKAMGPYHVNDLNYPSFAVSIRANPKGCDTTVTHRRTLTNVGPPGTYIARITSPGKSVLVSVDPSRLTFARSNEKKSYTLTVTASTRMEANTSEFGRIEWINGKDHVVGSPIAISKS